MAAENGKPLSNVFNLRGERLDTQAMKPKRQRDIGHTPRPASIGFDAATGTFTNIDAQCALDFTLAYPDVHLDAEIKRAAIWILSNPAKAPTGNYARFLASWLSGSQDKIGIVQPGRHFPPRNQTEQRRNFIDGLMGRL